MKRTDFQKHVYNLVSSMTWLFLEKQTGKKISDRIERGRVAPLADKFEDMFALFLHTVLPDGYEILVDYPTTYRLPNSNRAITLYPDIQIIKNGTLKAICELKIDLGYAKPSSLRKKLSEFEELKNAGVVSFKTHRRDKNRVRKKLEVSQDAKIFFVILSALNDHGRLEQVKDIPALFILSKNRHPNGPDISYTNIHSVLQQISENPDNIREWQRLEEFLKNCFGLREAKSCEERHKINKFMLEFLNDASKALQYWDNYVRDKFLNSFHRDTFYKNYWKGLGTWSVTEPILKFFLYIELCNKYRIRPEDWVYNDSKLLDFGIYVDKDEDSKIPEVAVEMKWVKFTQKGLLTSNSIQSMVNDFVKLKKVASPNKYIMQFAITGAGMKIDPRMLDNQMVEEIDGRITKKYIPQVVGVKTFPTYLSDETDQRNFSIILWEIQGGLT